jgi:hypothetical protein
MRPAAGRVEVVRRAVSALVLGLALRISYLSLTWLLGRSNGHRFKVESTTLLFVLVGITLRLFRHTNTGDERRTAAVSLRAGAWPIWLGLAFVLYWPALQVGLLSDDFGLVERARRWDLSAAGPHLFRPLPLGVWALLLSMGNGPRVLHAINILLHGTNAYLASLIASNLGLVGPWSVLAGSVMLTLPLGVEPVAWCSGIFDFMTTTCVYTGVVAARDYARAGITRRAVVFGLVIVGQLTKETGVVFPVLLWLDAAARRQWSRKLLVDSIVMMSVVAAMVALRLVVLGPGDIGRPVTKYLIQQWLFRSFGALAVPWHVDVIRGAPWIPLLATALTIAVMTGFFIQRDGSAARTRVAALGAAWVLVAVLPTATFLYVAPDLQGARYLYLSGQLGHACSCLPAQTGGRARGRREQPVSQPWRSWWPSLESAFACTCAFGRLPRFFATASSRAPRSTRLSGDVLRLRLGICRPRRQAPMCF